MRWTILFVQIRVIRGEILKDWVSFTSYLKKLTIYAESGFAEVTCLAQGRRWSPRPLV